MSFLKRAQWAQASRGLSAGEGPRGAGRQLSLREASRAPGQGLASHQGGSEEAGSLGPLQAPVTVAQPPPCTNARLEGSLGEGKAVQALRPACAPLLLPAPLTLHSAEDLHAQGTPCTHASASKTPNGGEGAGTGICSGCSPLSTLSGDPGHAGPQAGVLLPGLWLVSRALTSISIRSLDGLQNREKINGPRGIHG